MVKKGGRSALRQRVVRAWVPTPVPIYAINQENIKATFSSCLSPDDCIPESLGHYLPIQAK